MLSMESGELTQTSWMPFFLDKMMALLDGGGGVDSGGGGGVAP